MMNNFPYWMMNMNTIPYWMLPQPVTRASGHDVISDKGKFEVNLDVSHFEPEELTVKTVDNTLLVTGKHEEKMDEHGFVSRQFSRKYMLPKDVDVATITYNLTANGIMSIKAPKKPAIEASNERPVPIQTASAVSTTANEPSAIRPVVQSKPPPPLVRPPRVQRRSINPSSYRFRNVVKSTPTTDNVRYHPRFVSVMQRVGGTATSPSLYEVCVPIDQWKGMPEYDEDTQLSESECLSSVYLIDRPYPV